jgi:signal transduction histidine kinase
MNAGSTNAPAPERPARGDDRIAILLVDDEPRNLDALEAILGDSSYRLLRAGDADNALKTLLHHDVAAIVLDIKMPGVSGIELAQTIKGTKKFRQIPILFLTAYLVDDQDVITGYGAGAVDYLTKPVNPQILRHKIGVFADLFRKTRALAELNETLEERVRERTAELERSEAALRAADRQKDEFIAILAHELRNPLAPIRTGIDLLNAMQKDASPIVVKTLGAMGRQLDHMVRLIDDLLDTSRVTRGALELQRDRVDLRRVVETAFEAARPFFERRQQVATISGAPHVYAHVDQTRIAQIIGNVLHNAAKFTPEGGTIRIELDREDESAVIRVIDSGQGIAPEQIDRVFDMFARIERPGAREGGLGIGLALARRLAEMHGGTLTAESAGRGQGTTVTLTLPALESEQRKSDRPVTPETAPLQALRILIIEDNDDVSDTMAAWLEQMGHRVSIARAGTPGVEQIREHAFDLVLCDLGLPDLDGLEVCRLVRQTQDGGKPVMVALTGWGREDDRRRTKEAGFDAHLVKPVAADKLKSLLRGLSAD